LGEPFNGSVAGDNFSELQAAPAGGKGPARPKADDAACTHHWQVGRGSKL